MGSNSHDCNVTIIGAGLYGLSAAAYLRAAGIEVWIFGEPMSFWEKQMPIVGSGGMNQPTIVWPSRSFPNRSHTLVARFFGHR